LFAGTGTTIMVTGVGNLFFQINFYAKWLPELLKEYLISFKN